MSRPGPTVADVPTPRATLRSAATLTAWIFGLVLVYLLRTPLGYLVLACFVAVSAARPVNALARHLRRGLAIPLVYLGIVVAPLAVGAILLPPVVRQAVQLVDDLPGYVDDLESTLRDTPAFAKLDTNFDLTQKLDEHAADLAAHLGKAASALAGVGGGLIGSLFALVTILVLSMFMVARGPTWRAHLLASRPPVQAAAMERASTAAAAAVSGYVGGALIQAAIAGTASFIVLAVLGVPSPLALAVVVALLDLIPLIGATLGAVIVGIVTLFADFPVDTVVWVVFAIAYQQFENYVVQPRIQSRAVTLDPFVIVVAAMFGTALLGVLGAVLAIPAGATIQIAVREYRSYRAEVAS